MKALLFLGSCALLVGCHRGHHDGNGQEPAPPSRAMLAANADSLQKELQRARERFASKKELGCQSVLSEPADLALCSAATAAVAQASTLADATPTAEATHEVAEAALTLDRVLERVRFLGFGDVMRRRVERAHDGALASAAPPSAARPSAAPPSAARPSAAPPSSPQASGASSATAPTRERALTLEQSPLLLEAQSLSLLERQALRTLGAYLEYGKPEARDVALAECRRLADAHPKFPALARELQEASVLESDPARKAALEELVTRVSGPRHAPRAEPQPTGSK
ncbi:MAG TPA: hypothetical protein VGI10_00225 [Polyangiaceae bacterium]